MSKVAEANVVPRMPPPPPPPVVRDEDHAHPRIGAQEAPANNAWRGFDDTSSFTPSRRAQQHVAAQHVEAQHVVAQHVVAQHVAQPAQPAQPAPRAQPAQPAQPAAPAPAEPFGRAASGAVRLSPNDLGVIPQDQGNTNACGTTSLANVMTHFGARRTHEQIDRGIRAFDMFTAPDRIADFARASGMRASVKPEATMNDLTRMIDQGVPPIVLYDPDEGNDAGLHYATVTGYNRGADGNVSSVVLANSAGAERQVMPADEFQRRWSNLQLHNVRTGMSNMMITAIPNDGRNIVGGDGRTRPAASITLPRSTLGGELRSTVARGGAQLVSDAGVTARAARDGAVVAADAAVDAARWTRDRVTTGAIVGAAVVGGGARRLWRSIFD